jgi:hypothetical protein
MINLAVNPWITKGLNVRVSQYKSGIATGLITVPKYRYRHTKSLDTPVSHTSHCWHTLDFYYTPQGNSEDNQPEFKYIAGVSHSLCLVMELCKLPPTWLLMLIILRCVFYG